MAEIDHIKVHGELPLEIPDGATLDIHPNGVTSHTHGFHKYPGKFIPQIPRWAICRHLGGSAGSIVLDPFCGSGTTLVESILSGNSVIGIDIDPLSVLISKVKTHAVNMKLLVQTAEWLDRRARARRGRRFRPECETLNHWFSKDAIVQLGLIRAAIDDLIDEFGDRPALRRIRDFWLVCFSSIIRRTSNADNESQKTFVSHTNPKTPENATELFCRRISFFVDRMEKYARVASQKSSCRVVLADSGNGGMPRAIKDAAVDLIVTSPPYIKAIDYLYNQMVELFWIGDLFGLQTQAKQNQRKSLYIGNKQIPASIYRDYDTEADAVASSNLRDVLRRIHRGDPKNGHLHAFITREYFAAMARHFEEATSILSTGGHYVMVVGNCRVSGADVDVKQIMSDIAAANGFSLVGCWRYKIKNRFMRFDRNGRGGFISHDWVLEMRRKIRQEKASRLCGASARVGS